MLSHHRQYFARAFRSKQDDTSELDMVDADGKQDIDDEEKVVKDAAESDYGSDLDDATLDELDDLATAFSQTSATPLAEVKTEEVEKEEGVVPERPERDESETYTVILSRADIEAIERIRAQLPDRIGNGDGVTTPGPPSKDPKLDETDPFSVYVGGTPIKREAGPILPIAEVDDKRTPRERFRKQRPLTVTDLVTPAWCELKYWYSLTKHGRVKRTVAMKQGSKVHKKLEQQVQVEVRVEIETKEDQMGLRLWNIIQGLRGLRATGLTRELEVFSVVDGDVVVGIIDALSYTCPDEKAEAELLDVQEMAKNGIKNEALPADQQTMTDFFGSSQEQAIFNSQDAWGGTSQQRKPARTIYLTDVKTRGSGSLPSGKRMQSTQMQLMLYRRMLSELASNQVEAQRVFDRYSMDSNVRFSDTFIANMADIDFSSSQQPQIELDDGNDEMDMSQSISVDALDEVTTYNTLALLWSHMIEEFRRTISVSSVSPLLTAEFRTTSSGNLIGRRSFTYDAEALDKYVMSELAWWRGERAAQGVDIEEASYKCGTCEFADECSWRQDLDKKSGQKGKLKSRLSQV